MSTGTSSVNRQHLIREFVKLAYPHVVRSTSAQVIRDAIYYKMPSLPDQIKNVSLVTMQTVIDMQGTRTSNEDHRSDQPQKTRVEEEEKEEEVVVEIEEREERKEASPGNSARRTTASEERSRLLASVPVLLAEDPEFDEHYSSSAFDSQLADFASTVIKETQRPTIPPITSPTEFPKQVSQSSSEKGQGDTTTGRRIQVQKLTGKRLYKGMFRIKKSSIKQPEATRTSIIQPPMMKRPNFPPQLVLVATQEVEEASRKRTSTS